jgi:hypothetical protein
VHAAPPRVKCWYPHDRRIVSVINGAGATAVLQADVFLAGRSAKLIDERTRIDVAAAFAQKRAPRLGA